MGKMYYSILGCGSQASQPEIAQRFRILALINHPEKNKDNGRLAQATYTFTEICEAYEVLSTPELKECYDKYGELLMKNGVPDKKLGFKAGYQFQGNSHEIFEKFFGTTNPFTVALDEDGDQIGMVKGKSAGVQGAFAARFQNLTVTVNCTLEEFYYGCRKDISFERLLIQGDGKRQSIGVCTKKIQVKPGMGPQDTLEFAGEGHQRPGRNQSDLIIEFKQIPHAKFNRFGTDLILEHKISLLDSLKAGPISFTTIENEQIKVSIDHVINPETVQVVPGKGMPVLNNDPLGPIKRDYARGNLIVKFDIQFPNNLNEDKKTQLISILDEVTA